MRRRGGGCLVRAQVHYKRDLTVEPLMYVLPEKQLRAIGWLLYELIIINQNNQIRIIGRTDGRPGRRAIGQAIGRAGYWVGGRADCFTMDNY